MRMRWRFGLWEKVELGGGRGDCRDERAYWAIAAARGNGIIHTFSVFEGGKRTIAHCPYVGCGVTGSGVWSSAATPVCPFLIAQNSGVWPDLSGLSGLASPRVSSIFTSLVSISSSPPEWCSATDT